MRSYVHRFAQVFCFQAALFIVLSSLASFYIFDVVRIFFPPLTFQELVGNDNIIYVELAGFLITLWIYMFTMPLRTWVTIAWQIIIFIASAVFVVSFGIINVTELGILFFYLPLLISAGILLLGLLALSLIEVLSKPEPQYPHSL